jgi:4-amino-4-deoxychorismate lyase
LEDGKISNLTYHQQRVNKVFPVYFPDKQPHDLSLFLSRQQLPEKGIFKCRIVYDSSILSFEILPYQMKSIQSFKLIEADIETTPYKPENRDQLNQAFALRDFCDDVLIVRNGLLTDSSYCNIALFDGKEWKTPRIPLYYGTRRASLLDQGVLVEADIPAVDLDKYQKIMFFNAMIPFGELEIDLIK